MNKPENEKENLDAQLRQLQELKSIGLLANEIVHSFNNVIGIIHGYADLALRTTPPSDRNYTYLKQIIEGANSAKRLTKKMRAFTKQKELNFKLTDIRPIVEEAIEAFKVSLPIPIEIQQDIDETCGDVWADTDQIRQAVINLCRNAYEAMHGNGCILKIILKRIDIDASFAEEHERFSEGKYVKLIISDTGHGMDQDVLKMACEPFFTNKDTSKHAGLGLAIVREVVKNHQGEMMVESSPGEGTVFDIYFPLAPADREKEGG